MKLLKFVLGALVILLALLFVDVLSWTTVLIVATVAAAAYAVYLGLLWLSPNAQDAHAKRAGKRNPIIVVGAVLALTAFGYALDQDFPPAEALVSWLQART